MGRKWNRCVGSYAKWIIRLLPMFSSHMLNLFGQDCAPQQVIIPIVDVSKYRNHHAPCALLSQFSEQGAIKSQIPEVTTRWNCQLECIRIYNKNTNFI